MSNPFVEEVVATAVAQNGVRENRVNGRANNTGRMVETFQRSVGIPPGSAWCAAFVYWAIAEVAKKNGLSEVPFLRHGYCPTIHSWAKNEGLVVTTPQRGDAFLRMVDYPDGRFASHIGLVTGVEGNRFTTIEGNTNAGLSNEGDGVYDRSRPINNDYVFIRWSRLLPDEAEAQTTYQLFVNSKKIADMPIITGRSMCPLRAWASHWGMSISWDTEFSTVLLNGKTVQARVMLIGGASYSPIAELVRNTKLKMTVDNTKRRVDLTGSL